MRNTTTTNIIQSIDPSSVHRICSGQVILDISSCAKELIENSIDAGATNVEIRIREFGLESVEVSENGSGVARDDIQMLTMKYATSKLRTFKDLESGVETFGFRGEALSSLCGTCERLIITTRTASDEEGMKVTFDKNGDVETEEICARSVGTTVRVEKLFHPLPVRRKQFERNKAKEYAKLLRVLQGYALASETSGCRFVATHQQGKNGARQTVLQCRASVSNVGGGGFRDRVASVFGARTAESVFEIDIGLEREKSADEIEEEVKEEEEEAEDVDTDDDRFGRCTGWVSLPGLENKKTSARASADRQFFYVNGRPVDYPKIAKTLNETFRAYNATTTNANYPSCALNFEVPKHLVDVNVSPDKRTIMFTNEHDILMYFRNGIKKAFERAVGGNGERGSADGLVRNFKATGVDLSQLPMTPADALIDAPIKNTTMIDTDEFEVIDDSDGEQGGEGKTFVEDDEGDRAGKHIEKKSKGIRIIPTEEFPNEKEEAWVDLKKGAVCLNVLHPFYQIMINSDKLEKNVIVKLDVQGFELEVLKGAKKLLNKIDYIITEMSYQNIYKNQVVRSDLKLFLKKNNFVKVKNINITKFDKKLFQSDALFRKKLKNPVQNHCCYA